MRKLLRWLLDVPTSVTALGRRLDELEDGNLALAQRIENLRGQLLTQTRRITRLQAEWDPELDDEEGDDYDELLKLREQRRREG